MLSMWFRSFKKTFRDLELPFEISGPVVLWWSPDANLFNSFNPSSDLDHSVWDLGLWETLAVASTHRSCMWVGAFIWHLSVGFSPSYDSLICGLATSCSSCIWCWKHSYDRYIYGLERLYCNDIYELTPFLWQLLICVVTLYVRGPCRLLFHVTGGDGGSRCHVVVTDVFNQPFY